MKVIIQRVLEASCIIDKNVYSAIRHGYLLLVGLSMDDNEENIQKMAKKIVNLRIFSDENDKMNLSIMDVKGEILSISQFTLYADSEKGNRPSFTKSLHPNAAKPLYHLFNETLRSYSVSVKEGVFGAHMDISLINNGPVTIVLEF